jgi:predicted ATP-grasp superfamily ATP-dependent carboligase
MSRRRLRVLLSEGSSLSARQTVWALGIAGHAVDVCDPNPLCLSRFSRFVRRVHRSPHFGSDPLGYLAFVLNLLRRGDYDVLLPVHEQILLFARVRRQIPPSVASALPDFVSLGTLLSKASFIRLLDKLALPHPPSTIVTTPQEVLRTVTGFPCYVKTALGTASSGVWRVDTKEELARVVTTLEVRGWLQSGLELIVQAVALGTVETAQMVCDQGRLVAFHCYRKTASGQRGGMAAKLSVQRPLVREHLEAIVAYLAWHGSVSIDYLLDAQGQPFYIDANPRLVEPMNAVFSGVNLADLLVRLSVGEHPGLVEGRSGVASHMLMQAILGTAERGGSRLTLTRKLVRGLAHRGSYAQSREELTPVFQDPPALIALAFVGGRLLARPQAATSLAERTVSDYALSPAAFRVIMSLPPE